MRRRRRRRLLPPSCGRGVGLAGNEAKRDPWAGGGGGRRGQRERITCVWGRKGMRRSALVAGLLGSPTQQHSAEG